MEQSAAMLFAIEGSRPYGERLAGRLEWPLSAHEERSFEDGEHKIRSLVDVRRHDVYVIHSLNRSPDASPNDKLNRLLSFYRCIEGLRRHTGHGCRPVSLLCP